MSNPTALECVEYEFPPVMVKVNGKSFHCHCGANVFHHPPEKPAAYECNGCGEWYIGE